VSTTSAKITDQPRRAYRQRARAKAAEATAERILDAFARRLEQSWFDEIRLDDVAADAEVSVQTIVRRFGGKDGLLEATTSRLESQITARRQVRPGDDEAALRVLIEDYEAVGDLVLRALAQEARYPAIRGMTDLGRQSHREWLAGVFEAALAARPEAERRRRLDALVVATDVYVWKLVRRDLGRPLTELRALMRRMIDAALTDPER